MEFMTFWTHTYSPTKITYIITSVNVTYFYASSVTVFLYFLKTNNVSGYIMVLVITEAFCDHHFFTHTLNTILHRTLQRLLHIPYPSPTYAQTPFRNILPQNYLPASIKLSIQLMTLSRISLITISLPLSLTFNPSCAKHILHSTCQYTYLRTCTYL